MKLMEIMEIVFSEDVPSSDTGGIASWTPSTTGAPSSTLGVMTSRKASGYAIAERMSGREKKLQKNSMMYSWFKDKKNPSHSSSHVGDDYKRDGISIDPLHVIRRHLL